MSHASMVAHIEKNRSYRVMECIALHLEKPLHQDLRCELPVTFTDGRRAMLLGTSNAGFAGILGHFEDEDGQRLPQYSLGIVATVDDLDGEAVIWPS